MATQWVDPPGYTETVDAADDFILRQAGSGVVSGWFVSLVSASFSGSVTIKGRRSGTINALLAIPYKKYHLNGAVGDATYVSTAITGTSLIFVPSEGMDVSVSCTSFTSGSLALAAYPVLG